jgi:hypothetical protein
MIDLVTPQEMSQLLMAIPHDDSTIFSVVFVKRSNGELRKMTCRRGVKKFLAGGELGYNAKEKDLLPVFEIDKGQYRSISCEQVQELKLHGKTYQIPNARLI